MHAAQHGFNLVELMVTLAVLGVLITLGAPSFAEWLQNQQVRAAAEATLNGLQVARTEAVRRNSPVSFQFMADFSSSACAPATVGAGGFLTSASGPTTSWVVSVGDPSGACDQKVGDVPAGPVIQSRSSEEGTPNAAVITTPGGATTYTFGPLGGPVKNPDDSPLLQQIDVSSRVVTGSAARPLRIVIGAGGNPRMCDPAVAAGDTRACP